MTSENFVNLRKDDEVIRKTVLTNICRMLLRRGYLDKKIYTVSHTMWSHEIWLDDMWSNIVMDGDINGQNDEINNSKFAKFIDKNNDNNIYKIPLDLPYKDQRTKKKDDTDNVFDGSMVIIKLIPQNIKDISNISILNDFLKSHEQYHKIIVFDNVADKVYNVLSKKKNIEVFSKDYFMIDMMSHVSAPIACKLITESDLDYLTNVKISKICENDPLARYYDAKKNDILRILRTSLNNSLSVGSRRVTDPKPIFK